MVTEINLSSPAFKQNPYTAFTQIRTEDPVHQVMLPGDRQGWLITRYEEAELVLKDPRFVKYIGHALTQEEIEQRNPEMAQQRQGDAAFFSRNMLSYDPPDHTRLRALVNLSFTPRMVQQWHSRIQAIADELLDAVQDKGSMDLIDDFAFPLPITVITEMLGIPQDDQQKFRAWSNTLIEASGNPQDIQSRREQLADFRNYLRQLVDAKRGEQKDDLICRLLQAEAQGDKLNEAELVSMVFLLLIAGHETTVNLIGNGALALMLHPDQMEKLKQHPQLLNSAIEEFLRFQGPLMTATQRWAREDVELAGTLIHKGDYVVVVLASANRDNDTFAAADDLDIAREDNRHLAFGKGIHYCLGAPLARLEGQTAISTLLRRMPNLHLAVAPEELVWRPGSLIMGLRKLPVTF